MTATPVDADMYAGFDAAKLKHFLLLRDRQAIMSRKFWVRAAKKALDGDMRELRNRVELAEAEPMELVLSKANPNSARGFSSAERRVETAPPSPSGTNPHSQPVATDQHADANTAETAGDVASPALSAGQFKAGAA